MTIPDSVVGIRLPRFTRTVTWRETSSFAAAVGETSPSYLDDSREDGLLAPPLFAVAVTWPLLESLPNVLGGALPPEVVATLVHAGERLWFRRPVRPGDTLTLDSQVVALAPTRAGALLTLRTDAHGEDGNPTFTEWLDVLFRGVEASARAVEGQPGPLEGPDAGSACDWEAALPVPRGLPFLYDTCTGISFPIHTSVAFARAVGLPDLILHGTAALALAAREIVARECAGDPTRLCEIACRFKGFMIPGRPLSLRLARGEAGTVGFQVRTSEGQVALGAGVALVGQLRGS
jgi:acyl dehydratase